MRQHQTVKQRKLLKQSLVDPLTAVRRGLYRQARAEIAPKYQMPRLILVFLLLIIWLTASHATGFRENVSQWLVTGVYPQTHWSSIAFYVVSFVFSFVSFVWLNSQIDRRQEMDIKSYYTKLKIQYAEEHGIILGDQ